MKKQIRKGFTLTELVVVICIIGILIAIMIPLLTGYINKSRESSDNQLVRNLNQALSYDETTLLNGRKHQTMQEALDACKEAGFDVSKINATARNNEILWDSVNDVFCYLNDKKVEYIPESNVTTTLTENDTYKLWKISKTVADGEKYSIYYTGEDVDINLVGIGFDAGEQTVSKINYAGAADARNVVIRTTGGTLTINAASDTVKHYGTAEKIDVVAIANASYHENGTVQLIAVKQGHVKLEGDADVNGIYVYNDSTSTEKDDSFEEIKITVDSGVEVPKLSRSAVEIADEGTKVCTIVTDQAKDVYLFNEGIYEQIKTVDEGKPISDASATWADDETKNTDNTQTAAQQLANEWTGRDEDGNIANQTVTVAETEYTVVFNDETRKFETYTGYENENNKGTQIVVDTTASAEAQAAAQVILAAATTKVEETAKESGKTAEEAEKASALKGSGTVANPFLVYDYATMQKISDFYDLGYYYFEVALDKTDNGKIDLHNNQYIYLNGSFDGKGVVFTHVNGGMFGAIGTYDSSDNKPVILKNFTVQNEGGWGIVQECGATTLEFNNINVTGYSLHNWNAGEFLRYGSGEGFDYTVNFVNCSCNAEIYSTQNAWSTILVGHTYPGGSAVATINVDTYTDEHINDSVLYYTGTGTSEGHKYYGMGGVKVYVNGVEKNANDNKVAVGKIVRVDATKNPTKTESGYSINTQSDTRKIVVTLLWQYTEWEENYTAKIPDRNGVGGTIGKTLTFEVDGSADIKVFDTITSVEVRTSSDKWDYELKDGKLIIYMQNTNTYIDGNLSLFVEQYTYGSNIAKYKGSLNIASKTTSSEWVIK